MDLHWHLGHIKTRSQPGPISNHFRLAFVLLVLVLPAPGHADSLVAGWGRNTLYTMYGPVWLRDVKAIAAGYANNVAVTSNGVVVTWAQTASFSQESWYPGVSNATAVACGAAYSLALKTDGTVAAWGTAPYVPPGLSNVVAVAAGISHFMALKTDGTVVVWGSNTFGQTNIPSGLSNVTAIAAGDYHCLALRADGTVVAWGSNVSGQANVPSGLSNVITIAAGADHSLAADAQGRVTAWGRNTFGQTYVPAGLSNVTAVAAGRSHSLALKADGTVVAWGDNTSAQTNIPAGLSHVVAISARGSANLALASGGIPPFITYQPVGRTVPAGTNFHFLCLAQGSGMTDRSYQWQRNGTALSAAGTALGLSNAQVADSGVYSVLVSNAFGVVQSVDAWLTVADSAPYIVRQPAPRSVPPGGAAVFSVNIIGSEPLFCQWRFHGQNIPGATNQVLELDSLGYSQAGYYDVVASNWLGQVTTESACLFVTRAFVVIPTTSDSGYPILGYPLNLSEPGSNLTAVATALGYTIALRNDGQVVSWACNECIPATATNVTAIAAGGNCAMALKVDGTVMVWGSNYYGQTNVPVGLSNVTAIAAGLSHCLALRSEGTVVAWGTGSQSQTNPPPGLSDVIAVAAGESHSLALKTDGTVVAWGANDHGQCDVPSGLSNVIALAGGAFHSVALKSNGSVVAWGLTSFDETSAPPGLTNVVAIAAGNFRTLVLRADGTIVHLRFNWPFDVPAWLSNVFAIAEGQDNSDYSISLMGDGSPKLSLQPASQKARPATCLQLHARAAGLHPMTYQWQHNGRDLPGATDASLVLPNFQAEDAGDYQVFIANALGVTASRVALVSASAPTPPRLVLRTLGSTGGAANGGFEAVASLDSGQALQPEQLLGLELRASSNLVDWVVIPNALTLTNGSLLFRDPDAKNHPERYYRLFQP